jgi:adenylosuccinate lyase
MVLAIKNINTGISRLTVNNEKMINDIHNNRTVFMELFQLKLRKWDVENGYDICKEYSRGVKDVDVGSFINFLKTKNVDLGEERIKELDIDYNKVFLR